MTVLSDIKAYLAIQPETKRKELEALQGIIKRVMPKAKVWYLDGKNEQGKVVTNPNIGYGAYTIKYANGTTKEFYKVGLSANTSGLSVFLMGFDDKTYLPKTYGKTLGKADVSSYCIKFKALKDIDLGILEAAIRDRAERA